MRDAPPSTSSDPTPTRRTVLTYALETLYEHQDHDFVVDTIADVIAWVHTGDEVHDPQPFVFKVRVDPSTGAGPEEMDIALVWDVEALERRDGHLRASIERLRSGRTVNREHVAEVAAYGLALVAISVLMPGRRVVGVRKGHPPDFLLEATAGALRGVEVAGRTEGGFSALRTVRRQKVDQLMVMSEVVEAHLSLWCAHPRVGELYQVKP